MKVLSAQKIDLMFVDINMPDLNGMDLYVHWQRNLWLYSLLLILNLQLEGFKVDAVDYFAETIWFPGFSESCG